MHFNFLQQKRIISLYTFALFFKEQGIMVLAGIITKPFRLVESERADYNKAK